MLPAYNSFCPILKGYTMSDKFLADVFSDLLGNG